MSTTSVDPLALLTAPMYDRASPVRFSDLGGVDLIAGDTTELLNRAELPELLEVMVDDADALGNDAVCAFLLAAAATPRNPFTLSAVVDALLSRAAAVAQLGDELIDIWLDISREQTDLIGGIALEGSARLVLAEAGSPYALLDRLKRLQRELPKVTDDFATRAVRVAGAVAEHFNAPEVPALLEALVTRDDVADDAAFELAMLSLRQALATEDPDQARAKLIDARTRLTDAYSEDERADAAAFGAAIDAVLAYSSGAPVAEDTYLQLRAAVLDIRLNLLRMRFDTLGAWQQLVASLERAQAATEPRAWLHAAALISDLVAVYSAHRSLDLLAPTNGNLTDQHPHPVGTPGLHLLLAPQVRHVLMAHDGGLALLDQWLQELQDAPNTDDDPTTDIVREQALALREVLATVGRPPDPKPDGPTSAALVGLLGPETARQVGALLAPQPLLEARLSAMLEARQASDPVDAVPLVARTFHNATQQLRQQCPEGYTGQFAVDIDQMLLLLLRFMNLRLGETQKFGGEARKYLRQLGRADPKPLEKELGKDLRDFLTGMGLRVELEVSNVGAGRVDIGWRPHDELITLELKRDWQDVSWDALEKTYLPQAISYQVSGPPMNFFIVLDLTDKPDGLAALSSCVEVRTVPGPAGDPRPRTVIMLRVQGNKRDPSSL